MIEKITKNNDQPASLLLQQKLETGPEDLKTLILECVIEHALSLMRNRFGNFLVQRCLEHGSLHCVQSLLELVMANVQVLACDRFGCHVVQKILDIIDEPLKMQLIQILAFHMPETIKHKFGCHVWQKIIQITWSTENSRFLYPLIQALKGQWSILANDESGSLIVQCIFENAPLIKPLILDEINNSILIIAQGKSTLFSAFL